MDKEGQSIAFGRRRGAYTSTDTSNVHLVPTERITFSLGIVEPQPGEPAGKILGLDFNVTVTLQQCIGVPSNSPGSTLRFERELLVNGALNDGTVELRPSDCKGGIVTTVKLEGLSEARRSPFGKSDTTVPSREKLGQVLQNSLQQAEEACARATADRLAVSLSTGRHNDNFALMPFLLRSITASDMLCFLASRTRAKSMLAPSSHHCRPLARPKESYPHHHQLLVFSFLP